MTNTIKAFSSSPYEFFFLVHDQNLYIDIPDLKSFHLIFSKKPDFIPKSDYFISPLSNYKNSGDVLSNSAVINFILSTAKNKKVCIIPFKPSFKIDLICQKNDFILISNPSKLNRFIEDKLKFYTFCIKNHLPIINSYIGNFDQNNYHKATKIFGQKKLVIQTSFGWAGQSTFMLNDWTESHNIKIPNARKVKYMPFLSGTTLLNNCCIYKKKLYMSPTAQQLNNISKFSINPFATVGRYWPTQMSEKIKNQIITTTHSLFQCLNKLNYHGYFGIDFFYSQKKLFILECNPRLTASFSFYHQLENKLHLTPLFFLHLAEFCNIDLNISRPVNVLNKITGFQITPRDTAGKIVKKIESFSKFSKDIIKNIDFQ